MTTTITGLSATRLGRTILHETTINFEPGERIGLVGASGSGKSTFGTELVDQMRRDGYSVAHVPQSPDEALDPLRSMDFHWREAEAALGLAHDAGRRVELFSALRIENADVKKRPWGWSRGMQQRFVIAMALLGSPQLIVLDEPTSALDPIVAAATMDCLDTTLSDRETTTILITHDLGLAAERVSRLMVMDAGRIVEDRASDDLIRAPHTPAAQGLTTHRHWVAV